MSKIKFPQMDNVNQFRQVLLACLNKLADQSTIKPAIEEIQLLMKEHTINNERLNVVVYHITEFNDTMKTFQRREHIKLLGMASEIFQDKLIQFMPKILAFYSKRIKDADQILHPVIAESLGTITHQILRNVEDNQVIQEQMTAILKQVYHSTLQSNKIQQLCASQCLTKVIQNSPVFILKQSLPKICAKLCEFFGNNQIKCKTQLLETVISLTLTVGKDIHQQVPQLIQHIINCMENAGVSQGSADQQYMTRKVAIDCILTIAKTNPISLKPYRKEINDVLNQLRFDKIKPVRDASVDVLNVFKDIPELYYSEEERLREQELKEQQKLEKQQKQQEMKKDLVKRNPRIIPNVDQDTTVTINGVVFSNAGGDGPHTVKNKKLKDLNENQLEIDQQQQQDSSRKVTTATQKRREAKMMKMNKKSNNNNDEIGGGGSTSHRHHESIFKRGSINQDFLSSAGQVGNKKSGIEIFAPKSGKGGVVVEDFNEDEDNEREMEDEEEEDVDDDFENDDASVDKIKQDKTPGAGGTDQSAKNFNNKKPKARDFHPTNEEDEEQNDQEQDQEEDNSVMLTETQKQRYKQQQQQQQQKRQSNQRNNRATQSNSQIMDADEEQRQNQQYQDQIDEDNQEYDQNSSYRAQAQQKRQIRPYNQQQNDSELRDDDSHDQSNMRHHHNGGGAYFGGQGTTTFSANNNNNMPPHLRQPVLNQHQQQSLRYILMEIEKISKQQARMLDNMQDFQQEARNELAGLRQRVHVMDQKVTSVYYMKNGRYPNSQNTAPPGYNNAINQRFYNFDNTLPVSQRGGRPGQRMQMDDLRSQRSPQTRQSMPITQNKQNYHQQQQQSDWEYIQHLIQQKQLSEAYQIAISKSDDDLLLIKLMGKTGICLQQLLDDQQQSKHGGRGNTNNNNNVSANLVEFLIQRIIAILTTKEFVNVLLPWITELSDIFVDQKQQNNNDSSQLDQLVSQTVVSDLIEVLIGLMNDVKSGIDEMQKDEIHRIYENLSVAFKM